MDNKKLAHRFAITYHVSDADSSSTALAIKDEDGKWCMNSSIDIPDDVAFFVGQLEVTPSTGRIHVQAAVDMVNWTSVADLLKRTDQFGNKRIHYTYADGSRDEQIAYCSKRDTRYDTSDDASPMLYINVSKCAAVDLSLANPNPQNKKDKKRCRASDTKVVRARDDTDDETDEKAVKKEQKRRERELRKAKEQHMKNELVFNLIGEHKTLAGMYTRCLELGRHEHDSDSPNLDKLRIANAVTNRLITSGRTIHQMAEEIHSSIQENVFKNPRKMDVSVYFGSPGSGKSTAARERFAGYTQYWHIASSMGKFMCTYDGELMLVLDEFGGGMINPTFTPQLLLAWTVGDPLMIEVKCKKSIRACWVKVLIISNFNIDAWFNYWTLPGFNNTVKCALLSRIQNRFTYFDGADLRALSVNLYSLPERYEKSTFVDVSTAHKQKYVAPGIPIDLDAIVNRTVSTPFLYDDDYEPNTQVVELN